MSISKTEHLTFSTIFLDTLPKDNSFFTPVSFSWSCCINWWSYCYYQMDFMISTENS